MSRVQQSIDASRRQQIYKAVVSNTTDIGEIAAMSNISYAAAVDYLEDLIALANRRSTSKQWYAFAGARIDHAEKRIVLAIQPDELVARTDSTLSLVFLLMGCFFGLIGLVHIISDLLKNGVSNIILAASFFGGFSAIFIFVGYKLRNREKRIKRYVSLINNEKRTDVRDIANATRKSAEFVRKDLQKFIKYMDSGILNARYDAETDRVVVIARTDKSLSNLAASLTPVASPQDPLGFNENKINYNETEVPLISVNFPTKQITGTGKFVRIGVVSVLIVLLTIFTFTTFSQSIGGEIKFRAAERYDTQATVISKEKKGASGYATFYMLDIERELDWYVGSDIYDEIFEGDEGVLHYRIDSKNSIRFFDKFIRDDGKKMVKDRIDKYFYSSWLFVVIYLILFSNLNRVTLLFSKKRTKTAVMVKKDTYIEKDKTLFRMFFELDDRSVWAFTISQQLYYKAETNQNVTLIYKELKKKKIYLLDFE